MAFLQKTWKDRVAEYINRRVLTKEDGTTELVSVERSEGTISQEGDAFSAANMNDLEQRIANEFSEQNKNIADCFQSVSNGKALVASAITGKGVTTASDATFATMATNIGNISSQPKALLFAGSGSNNEGGSLAHCFDTEFANSVSASNSINVTITVKKEGTYQIVYRVLRCSTFGQSTLRKNGTDLKSFSSNGGEYKTSLDLKVGDTLTLATTAESLRFIAGTCLVY